jgi:mRNA interferase RelE/StbE
LKVEFRKSFLKDLETAADKNLRRRIRQTIERVEQARSLHEVEGVRKLRGGEGYYRIRMGDYRFGLVVKADTVIFVRFLHRKDVYRYFP